MAPVKDVLWRPSPELLERARVTGFMRKHGIKDTAELLRRSAEDTSWFWDAALKDLGVRWFKPYTKVQDGSKGFPWTRWFLDGKINIVANCLDPAPPEGLAIIGEGDDGAVRAWTYRELNGEVSRVAGLLRKLGVGKGDAVGIYMPMVPEIVAAFFGCLKIGAVPVPVFSAFGAPALAVRLRDAEAKVLFTADGVSHRGKRSPLLNI